jgi:hypothetical protein
MVSATIPDEAFGEEPFPGHRNDRPADLRRTLWRVETADE